MSSPQIPPRPARRRFHGQASLDDAPIGAVMVCADRIEVLTVERYAARSDLRAELETDAEHDARTSGGCDLSANSADAFYEGTK